MRCTQSAMCLYTTETQPSFVQANLTESLSNIVCAFHVFAMGTRKRSRSFTCKPPIKLTDYEMDDLLKGSATPQQISEAVKRELSQVESMIKDLSPTSDKSQQSTVKQDRTLLPPPPPPARHQGPPLFIMAPSFNTTFSRGPSISIHADLP